MSTTPLEAALARARREGAAEERELCAQECEERARELHESDPEEHDEALACARTIRLRGRP